MLLFLMAEGKQPDSQSALFLPHRKDENKLFQSAKKYNIITFYHL